MLIFAPVLIEMNKQNKRSVWQRLLRVLLIIAAIFFVLGIIFAIMIYIPEPDVNKNLSPHSYIRKQTAPEASGGGYTVNNCHLKKNKYGIYEMYIEGDDYERGLIYGVLAKELIEKQENFFVNQINELVPNA